MLNISLPSKLWLFTRYALVVNETKVELVSWKRGSFTKLGEYVNDNQGIADFSRYLKQNAKRFESKPISVCVNIVGEDYRFEKLAHLVGKYKSDMLKRRFAQLFRGAQFHQAIPQGREAIGRRLDFYLFCGVLSSEKVQPWVRELSRINFNVAGVHLSSLLAASINKHVIKDQSGVNVTSFCVEDGGIRHNFFVDGKLRFSRLSRIADSSGAEDVFKSVRTEIEKTAQYLASIKLIANNAKINAHIVCADDLVDGLNDLAMSSTSERITFSSLSAREMCRKIGVERPLDEFGRDSSHLVHEMLRSVRLSQLAPLVQMRYYLGQQAAILGSVVVLCWGIFNLSASGLGLLSSYGTYATENQQLQRDIAVLKQEYSSLVAGFVEPPSTSENMQASVDVLDHATSAAFNPGKMMLYISKLLENYPAMELKDFGWGLSNSSDSVTGSNVFANGQKVYELVTVSGFMSGEIDPEVAFDQYQRFIDEIKKRPDMTVSEVQMPALLEAGGRIQGTLDNQTDVRGELNAFTRTEYEVRISWDPQYLENMGKSES